MLRAPLRFHPSGEGLTHARTLTTARGLYDDGVPTYRDPLGQYNIAAAMLACIESQLVKVWNLYPELTPTDDDGNPQAVPGRSCVIAGGIAWDDCECGQLVVAIGQTSQSQNFPNPLQAGAESSPQSRCGARIVMFDYTASILRCAPETSDEHPPACEELDTAAQVATIDAWAVRTGILCCLKELASTNDDNNARHIQDYVLGNQPFVGPAGLCQGSEQAVLVGINNVCPCGLFHEPEES